MSRWYALARPDGGVSITEHVAGDLDEVIRKIEQSYGFNLLSVREIRREDLPADRTFRNALKPDLTHDMPKARDIWRDKMRAARAPLLAALDQEMSRAYKDPIRQDEIEAKRQALRDVTADPAIEAAGTPEELKAVWPQILVAPAPVTPRLARA